MYLSIYFQVMSDYGHHKDIAFETNPKPALKSTRHIISEPTILPLQHQKQRNRPQMEDKEWPLRGVNKKQEK